MANERIPWYDVRARTHNNTPKGFRTKERDFSDPIKPPEEKTDASLNTIRRMLENEKGISVVKLSFRVGGATAALTVLATAAWQGYDKLVASEPTSIEETIDSVPGGTSFNSADGPRLVETKKVNPKEVFKNTTTKGRITTQNSVMIKDTETLKNMSPIPSGSNPNHDIYLLTPRLGQPPEDGMGYRKDFTGKNAFNPIYAPEVRKYAIEKGVKNEIFIKVKKGDVIAVPALGPNLQFMYNRIRENDLPEGTLDGATILYKDENNILHQVLIDDASAKPLAPIMSDIKPRGIKDDFKKFLHPTETGQPLLKVLEDGEIVMFTQAWPSGQSGLENKQHPVYPTNINLATLPDPSTGKNKVAVVDR